MENWFLVLLPVGLLAIVSGLCFVGCVLNTHGTLEFSTYSNDDVLANPDCVAFWPLNEPGSTVMQGGDRLAIDAMGKQLNDPHNGTYTDFLFPEVPGEYPCPSFVDSGARSATCSGALTLGAPGIVLGDWIGNLQSTAMQSDGAYVEIAPNDVTTPADAFSVEAWISPGWDQSDADAVHTFLDFRSVGAGGAISGFAMWVNGQGQLQGAVGLGADGEMIVTGGQASPEGATYVALTFDGLIATLFVNGAPALPSALVPSGQKYAPNTTGRQVIGAGAPWATTRTDQTASLFFPAFPFKGTIQDVAIYKAALPANTIAVHNQNGNGFKAE